MRNFPVRAKQRLARLLNCITPNLNTDKLAANVIGPFSLILISVLTLDIVMGIYVCIVPWKMNDWSFLRFAVHWIFGHLAALNVVYHFYKCAFSEPGLPTSENGIYLNMGWCRKCSAPKPPLTHHCSVCRRCVIRMDHHCTWMNNCIGINNHRHFFLFCLFMSGATFYAFNSGSEIYYEHSLYGFGFSEAKPVSSDSGKLISALGVFYFNCRTLSLSKLPFDMVTPNTKTIVVKQSVHPYRAGNRIHRFAVVLLYLCLLFSILLGGLVLWHAWLISIAHTSIDNLGGSSKSLLKMSWSEILSNWSLFLGLKNPNTSLLTTLLIPCHPPPTPLKMWVSRAAKHSSSNNSSVLSINGKCVQNNV